MVNMKESKKTKTINNKKNINFGHSDNMSVKQMHKQQTGDVKTATKKWKYLKFEKLVRDRNIDTIRASGGDVVYDLLSNEKKIFHLKQKLIEEAMEVFEAKNDIEFADELGDVLDVLKELIKTAKVRRYKIWRAQRKKAKFRGKFKKGIYCHYVKLPYELKEKWMEKYEDITDDIEKKLKPKNFTKKTNNKKK